MPEHDSTAEPIAPLEILEFGNFKAWRLDWASKLRASGFDPAHDGAVASWIIQAPWAHPVWNSYWLHFVHLRPIDRGEGVIPTIFYLEGATHELWLYALDPETPLEISIGNEKMPAVLTPKNFASQLILESDEAAIELARSTAKDVLEARLNPDTDAVRAWWARFGENMRKF
jgi:hypothetical protein